MFIYFSFLQDFRPHLPFRSFLLSQYLTNLGYLLCILSQIGRHWLRVPLQLLTVSVYVFVCVVHTDRWRQWDSSAAGPAGLSSSLVDRFAVAAADQQQVSEEYARLLNCYSRRLHVQLKSSIDNFLVNSENARSQFLSTLSVFSSSELGTELWSRLMPLGLSFSQSGLKIEGIAGIVVWEKVATAIEAMKKMFGLAAGTGPGAAGTDILAGADGAPTLEALYDARPNADLILLAKIKSIMETFYQFARLPYSQQSSMKDLLDQQQEQQQQEQQEELQHQDQQEEQQDQQQLVLHGGEQQSEKTVKFSFEDLVSSNRRATVMGVKDSTEHVGKILEKYNLDEARVNNRLERSSTLDTVAGGPKRVSRKRRNHAAIAEGREAEAATEPESAEAAEKETLESTGEVAGAELGAEDVPGPAEDLEKTEEQVQKELREKLWAAAVKKLEGILLSPQSR